MLQADCLGRIPDGLAKAVAEKARAVTRDDHSDEYIIAICPFSLPALLLDYRRPRYSRHGLNYCSSCRVLFSFPTAMDVKEKKRFDGMVKRLSGKTCPGEGFFNHKEGLCAPRQAGSKRGQGD